MYGWQWFKRCTVVGVKGLGNSWLLEFLSKDSGSRVGQVTSRKKMIGRG